MPHRTFIMTYRLLIVFLIIPIIGHSQNDFAVGVGYDWSQLEQKDKDLIKQSSDKYLRKLVANDVEGFWELCHPDFKRVTPLSSFKEMGKIISEMIPTMEMIEFIDAKRVVYKTTPKSSLFSTGGSIDKSNPTYLQFYTIEGIIDQSISLYKVKVKPLSRVIALKLGLEENEFMLTRFDINTCAIDDKDADYYLNIAREWENNNSQFSRFVALNMAYRLSYLGQGTSTSTMIDLTKSIQELQKDSVLITEIKKWSVNDSIYDIINTDLIETKSDITPNIIYLSKVPLGEESTKNEVKILFKYFSEKYPDLVNEFKKFVFTAYEEYPVLPTKQYKMYRVVMDVDELE